ncbi:sulfotransferase [Aliiglaciecola sp. 3_MG-2023]|uniref:sulfotransferase family protein n=1 Tax=Aliiglaciecola sp. 3_MG-2023 TaxID=3062644 RepID=UPI0026E23144|nr:sulfotransferase [Aliiglaciecola sp. 3_MG-2023]MDO6691921.1 sulfotransferase [Aliiglaciecola sp. 3_MG-2023]
MSDFQSYKKMLREWAFEQEPVFIVGPERSGTSLLFQQVSNHPSFCDFSHATVETFSFIRPWQLLEVAGSQNYEMRVYLGAANFTKFQESIRQLVERNKRLTENGMPLAYINEPQRKDIWFERRYKHVLRAFFHDSSINLGGKKLVEKTPAHIRCIDEIIATFPKAKILVSTRDIGEIIASHKKRFKKEIELGKSADDPSIAWLAHSVENYLKYLANIEGIVQRLNKQYAVQVKIVPYGKLTQSPVNTLKDIYSFIGVENINPENIQKERKTQDWDPLLNQLPVVNEVELTHYLSPSEIKMIENEKSHFSDFWY